MIPTANFRLRTWEIAAALALGAAGLWAWAPAAAQEPDPSTQEEQAPETVEVEQVEAVPEEPVEEPDGDKIYLKNGQVLKGVQVLRSTPDYIYIESMEGVEPMPVLRALVDRIEWDDIDLRRERRRLRPGANTNDELLTSGDLVSSQLIERLNLPLSPTTPLEYQQRDFVHILEELAKKVNVAIEFDDTVRGMRGTERAWTVTLPPDATLLAVLQERLPTDFPGVHAQFRYDKVVLQKREITPEPVTPGSTNPSPTAPQPQNP